MKVEIIRLKITKTKIRILNPINSRTQIRQLEGIMVAKQNIDIVNYEKIITLQATNPETEKQ